ncbi:MAG: leucine-rich repeat protein [Paludibacteraceae bacterium]|nr:leucine-rich repeat protein [Paludibacteraceae bacterium]
MKKFFLFAFMLLVAVTGAHAYDHYGRFPNGDTWCYTSETKTLTIDTDTVPDYSYIINSIGERETTAPWSMTNLSDAINIRYIVFTDRVKVIGKYAFAGSMADHAEFEESTNLVTIKEGAFFDANVDNFDFSRVKQIDDWAFYGTSLKFVYLPAIETINGAPFTNCTFLLREPLDEMGIHWYPSIVIASGRRDLTINGAIANYTKYAYGKQMVIMANMKNLGTQWPASVQTTVRAYYNKLVFGEPVNWTSSTAPDYSRRIDSYWYVDENKRLIVDYEGNDMPNNYYITSTPWWYEGPSAKEIHIFNATSDKAIGEYAFSHFEKVTKVEFHPTRSGQKVGHINDYAFEGCTLLSDIRLENISTIGEKAFQSCPALTYADLSECTSIGELAFNNCSLSSIYFSDKISSIGNEAFKNGIANNGHIYITRPTPPTTGNNVFSSVNQSTVTLHISEDQGNAYNVAPWNAFNRTAVGTKLYGVYSGSTLTIYYDGSMVSRGGYENWSSQTSKSANVTKVVFDSSVDNARPTSTYQWFSNFENLTTIANIEYLHTNKVTDMSDMFKNCKKLKAVGLSGFNTSNVTDMSSMFLNCESLTTLDVNSFDMSKVTNVVYMFDGCKNLVSIYCEKDWSENTTISTPHGYLFGGCTSLRGGKGTKFDASETALSYAHPDARPDNPGYFWRAGDDGINPDEPEEVDPYLTLCDVTGTGDFEDVLHSQFDDGNWDSDGQLAIVFTTSDSIYYDMNNGDLITHNQSGYLYIIRINPTSLDDLRGIYTLGRSSGGRITIEDGEMTYNDRFDNGNIIISLNEDETAYTVVINMTLYYSEVTLMGVVDGLCGGSIPSTPKYKVHVSGGYGEPYDTNGHTAIVESYAIFLQRDVYFEDVADTELSINVRNIDEGWTFDHWTVNGENVGSTRPLSYTISDEEAFIVAHYRSSASYYSVMVGSEHGTVYDENGTPLESYMGDPCFFADGPLSLNVTDIDEGWEFDYWLVDNQNVGSALPYTFTPNHDLTVVTAIYKQTSSGGQLEETYVCDFTTTATKHTGYTDAWTYDGEWTVFGGQNNGGGWNYVKMGAKSANLANANPVYIANKNAFSKEVKAVKVYYANGSFTKGAQMGVNEWGVKVYSDAAYTNLLYTIPSTETISGSEETLTVYPAEGQTWSAGTYIQVYWDLTNTSSTNGVLNIDKVAYLTQADGSSTDIESVTGTPSPVTQKIIRDGQLFIIRDGKTYNAQGARVQ